MRWLIVIGIVVVFIVAMVFTEKKPGVDVDAMMRRVRAAKKRKALERKNSLTNYNRERQGGNQTQAAPILKIA